MLAARNLRWAGAGISNGGQRLSSRAGGIRNFSLITSSKHLPHLTRSTPPIRQKLAQQSRSISLFGWGSSTKPSTDATPSPFVGDVQVGPNSTGLDNVRTIKASHSTSEIPDLSHSQHHPPNDIEPQFVENLQEKLTLPHGAGSEKVADIMSGDVDITTVSERMGYLKEVCGLDFGWGPTAIMENVLEFLHVYGGLSWTASIVAVAVLLRVVMFKPIVDSQIQGQKMRELQPHIKPLREKYMALQKEGNMAKATEVGAEMKEITKSFGVSYAKAFVPLMIQLPFGFGAFRLLRNAGQLPVPAFVTEDWLWTTDLSFSDPYFITPAISAAAIYFSFKYQQSQQTGNAMLGPQLLKVMGTALPIISFGFMSFQPGSVQLYFMVTGVLAFGTTALIRQTWVRTILQLGPLPNTMQSSTPDSFSKGSSQPDSTPTKALPANMQRIPQTITPAATPVESENVSKSNRSMIDKAVDNVKGRWSNMTEKKDMGTAWTQRSEKTQQEQREAAAAKYNAQRQIQLGKERDERNRQARSN